MDTDRKPANLTKGEPFFAVFGLLLTVIVISGFGASALALPEGPASLPLLYHLHGLIFLTWFVFFHAASQFDWQPTPEITSGPGPTERDSCDFDVTDGLFHDAVRL